MAITALNSFADVQSFIAQILAQNGEQGGGWPERNKAARSFRQFILGDSIASSTRIRFSVHTTVFSRRWPAQFVAKRALADFLTEFSKEKKRK